MSRGYNNKHEVLVIHKIKNNNDIEVNTYIPEIEFKILAEKIKEQRKNLYRKEGTINNLYRIISDQTAIIKKFSASTNALISGTWGNEAASLENSKVNELRKLIKQVQTGEVVPDVRVQQIKKVREILADVLKATGTNDIDTVIKLTREALDECYR